MADIGNSKNWLTNPTTEVRLKWLDCKIQERKSQMVRARQDIEDLQKGRIVELEAKILMLQREIEELEQEKVKESNTIDTTVN